MALHRHGSEVLPERRDISGSVVRSYERLRTRRGRKLGRFTKRMLSLSLLFLIYLLGFGIKLPFHGILFLFLFQI